MAHYTYDEVNGEYNPVPAPMGALAFVFRCDADLQRTLDACQWARDRGRPDIAEKLATTKLKQRWVDLRHARRLAGLGITQNGGLPQRGGAQEASYVVEVR